MSAESDTNATIPMPEGQPKPPESPYKEGDVLIIEGTVLRVLGNLQLIVKMANGTNQIFKPEQVAKKS